MKNLIILLIIFAFTAFVFSYIGFAEESKAENNNPTNIVVPTPTPRKDWMVQARSMPDKLRYQVLFLEINSLEKKDKEALFTGEKTNFKNSFYQLDLKLKSSQISVLDTAVTNFFFQIKPIDEKARKLVKEYREKYPSGELKKNQSPPKIDKVDGLRFYNPVEPLLPIPPELEKLQEQKDQIILNEIENIKISLGQTDFEEFDAVLKKHYERVIVPLDRHQKPEKFPIQSKEENKK